MDEQPNAVVESAAPSSEVAAQDAPAGAVVPQDATDAQADTAAPPAVPVESDADVVLLFKGTKDANGQPLTYVSGLPAHDLTRAQVLAYIGSAARLAAVLETHLFGVADGMTITFPDPAPLPE